MPAHSHGHGHGPLTRPTGFGIDKLFLCKSDLRIAARVKEAQCSSITKVRLRVISKVCIEKSSYVVNWSTLGRIQSGVRYNMS
jgi:hypothetical protein